VIEALVHAAALPAERLGARRTLLLTGISVSAQQMWDAVKDKATGSVRFNPDPAIQAVMDAAPKATCSERATRLGFSQNQNIEEIVSEYEEAALAHHG
jgi:nucleoside-diphosphate-sugar epimerase